MTTQDDTNEETLERLNANLAKAEELSQRLMNALSQKKPVRPSLQGPSSDLYLKAAGAYFAEMMSNPSKMLEHQVSYWGRSLQHFVDVQQALKSGELQPPTDPGPSDPRFSNPLWDKHPYFNFIKQQYLLNAQAVTSAMGDLDAMPPKDRKRLEYFSRQILDMLSPTNFFGTNPEALQRAVDTDGESLVHGMENLIRDLEANDGDLVVSLADKNAFQVGENLATTEGSVVFRNHLFELIQYAPKTESVHRTPLIIFPPWINKFYVLDLKDKNSLIKWVVEQGYTLFVVSWVNPDTSYRDTSLGDYIEDGFVTAINEVKAITGEKQVNAVGYCIAGTTLSLTLALLQKRKDKSVRSATFFTTLTDFSDQGEVGVFLDDDFVDGIEREVNDTGILDSFFMARTFSFLRSNDLIYTPAIRSYMMGEAPPAFDLLYWNGDGTNLPAKMAVEYLRGLCQSDRFATEGFELCGETLSIRDVKVPLCAIACETDHIAAWRSSFRGVQKMGSRDKTFVLAQSGHIAGIVNPPSKKKYGHYTNEDMSLPPEQWQTSATFNEGSWWPSWSAWLARRSGRKVAPRVPGDSSHPVLCPAPGTYVLGEKTG